MAQLTGSPSRGVSCLGLVLCLSLISLGCGGGEGADCSVSDDCRGDFVCFDEICTVPCAADLDCDDGIGCTANICAPANPSADARGCVIAPEDTACDDGVACVTDTCDPLAPGADPISGCINVADDVFCDDAATCTSDTCDPSSGDAGADGCVHVADTAACDDAATCTSDTCDPTSVDAGADGCVHLDLAACDDGVTCTADSCSPGAMMADPVTGCLVVPDDAMCDDSLGCTVDACDPLDALADPISGCFSVLSPVCDDTYLCTVDDCDPTDPGADVNGCTHVADTTLCDDGGTCTAEVCDPSDPGALATGCVVTVDSAMCIDVVTCTVDGCDPLDAIADPVTGCVNAPDDSQCTDPLVCTVDVCDPILGCTNSPDPFLCDDGQACTVDLCSFSVDCYAVPSAGSCDDGNDCTDDACDPVMGCSSTPVNSRCNDGRLCTSDSCGPMGCVNVPDGPMCDGCSQATVITAPGSYFGSTLGATDNFNTTGGTCGPGGAGAGAGDVVYRLDLDAFSCVVLTLDPAGTTYDSVLSLRNNCLSFGNSAFCDDAGGTGGESYVSCLTAGSWFFVIDGAGGQEGDYQLDVAIDQMGSDACPGDVIATGAYADDTTGLTDDYAGSCGGLVRPDMVYQFSLPAIGNVSLDTIGSEFDTVLYVYEGTCGDPGSEVACDNDSGPAMTSVLDLPGLAAGDYFVVVDGAPGADGPFALNAVIEDHGSCPGATLVSGMSTWMGDRCGVGDNAGASCGSDGSDVVFTFSLAAVTDVDIVAVSGSGGNDLSLAVRLDCDEATSEVGCGTGTGTASLTLPALPPGDYFVWVDGATCDTYAVDFFFN